VRRAIGALRGRQVFKGVAISVAALWCVVGFVVGFVIFLAMF
jgi:hypothetical protein